MILSLCFSWIWFGTHDSCWEILIFKRESEDSVIQCGYCQTSQTQNCFCRLIKSVNFSTLIVKDNEVVPFQVTTACMVLRSGWPGPWVHSSCQSTCPPPCLSWCPGYHSLFHQWVSSYHTEQSITQSKTTFFPQLYTLHLPTGCPKICTYVLFPFPNMEVLVRVLMFLINFNPVRLNIILLFLVVIIKLCQTQSSICWNCWNFGLFKRTIKLFPVSWILCFPNSKM